MKRKFALIVIASFIFSLLFLVAGIIRKAMAAEEIAERISTLPQFSLPKLDGGLFSSKEINAGPLLIIYFHPECEHCHHEISSIIESPLPDRDVKIILVSYASQHLIRSFIDRIGNVGEARILILTDTALIFRGIFGSDIIPSNYIYNKELELVKSIKGETRTETILKYLKSGS